LVPLIATIGLPVKFKVNVPIFSIVKVVADELFPDNWLPKENVLAVA